MVNAKIYRLRQAMVMALYGYAAPQDLETVLCAPECVLEHPAPDVANSQWNALIDAGILIPLPGYDRMAAKLAPHIRQEMDAQSGTLPRIPELFGTRVM